MVDSVKMIEMTNLSKLYDIIIVGAGLAGLSAAYSAGCAGYNKVLMLEAEEHIGGKVYTCSKRGVLYERGAIFAFDPEKIPFKTEAGSLINEAKPIGIKQGNRLVFKKNPRQCINEICPGLREQFCLNYFFQCERPNPKHIGDDTFAALNAFFRVVHPGNLEDYVPARRADSLTHWDVSHFEHGNRSLINAFIANSKAAIRPCCRVSRVEQNKNSVHIEWIENSIKKEANARWVILAVPAHEAKKLLDEHRNCSTDFLEKVTYGAGIVINIILKQIRLKPVSYIVSTSGYINTFIFSRRENTPDTTVVTAYLVAEKALEKWDCNDDELFETACRELNGLKIGEVTEACIDDFDVHRWPAVGPIISEAAFSGFTQASLHPLMRIILAGDYTWWNKARMPYGMTAAIKSGQAAIKIINRSVEALYPTSFIPSALAKSTVSILKEGGPAFTEYKEDGTIAYYGLIITALPDIEIERYLILNSHDGLWSYQHDSGVTSLDTALVMEGLLGSGRHDILLKYCCKRLVKEFFCKSDGGFLTSQKGMERASYWKGTDAPATAYCGWLLLKIDSSRHSETINRCAKYLQKKQLISGNWRGKWFTSDIIPVFYVLRFLVHMGDDYSDTCKRAFLWVLSRQNSNGAWGNGSIIETSAAVLSLYTMNRNHDAIQIGCEWLMSQCTDKGWRGEPILNYWLEDHHEKTYFHTIDNGAVTTAWATIALKTICGWEPKFTILQTEPK